MLRLFIKFHNYKSFYNKGFCSITLLRKKSFESRPALQFLLRNITSSSYKKTSFARSNPLSTSTNKLKSKFSISRLLFLARPERNIIIFGIGLLFISSAITLLVPFGIGKVIDIIYTTTNEKKMIDNLRKLCLLLFGIFTIGALANFGRIYIMQSSGHRIVKRLREQLFSSIIRQDVSFFDKRKSGELINRLSSDSTLVGNALTMNISDGLRSSVQAVGGITWMIYTCPKLALISMCVVPPVAIISRIYGKYLQRITKNVQDSLADSTQLAEERFSNMRTVQAFVKQDNEEEAYSQKMNHVLQLSYKDSWARALFWTMTGYSGNAIILIVFYSGGLMVSAAEITVGQLSSFLMYAAFVGMSIGGLGTFYSELMKGLGASSRVFEIIDQKPKISLTDGIIPKKAAVGEIKFEQVAFSYPERPDVEIFNSLDLTLAPGSVTALVGRSGCGKSTVASLLLRFYDPTSGKIFVDGMDVTTLNTQWLRSSMSIVSQEPALFSYSILDNIKYGSNSPDTVSFQEIVEASKMANGDQFIRQFPDGYNTLVGERGVLLSGGQKQRIAIARAILKNPKILLLDEATSALDSESERLVQEALDSVVLGRTVLIIAHRLSTIIRANHIAVLDEGRICEQGTYQQLLAIDNGMFKRLVDLQTFKS